MHLAMDSLTSKVSQAVHLAVGAAIQTTPQPKILKTDNGPGYSSTGFKQFCAQLGIKHITGTPYNPQGQGIVESTSNS